MKMHLGFASCVLLLLTAPALGGTDPWTDNWYENGDLGCTGITDANVTTFSPNLPSILAMVFFEGSDSLVRISALISLSRLMCS